jgi:hypothetical protein
VNYPRKKYSARFAISGILFAGSRENDARNW